MRNSTGTSDTGDGLVISVAPHISTVRLLDPLAPRLARRLAAFNRGKPPPNRMRLRVAVHAGGVLADPQPLHGDAVIHTCRLLDSPAARSCLKATQRPLVVIVSRIVYDEVVKHACGRIIPAAWQPVTAQVKETSEPAWIHVPGDPDAPIRAKIVTPPVSLDLRTGPAPRELPGRLAEFTGRHQELARLHELLGAVTAGTPAVAITAIDGLGGVGKSSLAVEGAWRLADRFPDGQLYLDLHGSTIGLEPLTPLQALTHLLGSLGTDPNEIPTEVEEATARNVTAGKQRVEDPLPQLSGYFDPDTKRCRATAPGHQTRSRWRLP